MTFLIRHFAPFWAMKRAIIKAALYGMTETGKELMIKQIIVTQLPEYHLHKNPRKER